jgi:hypothetical protein
MSGENAQALVVTEAFIAEILVSVLEFSVEPAGETFARTHNCTNENERSSMMAFKHVSSVTMRSMAPLGSLYLFRSGV